MLKKDDLPGALLNLLIGATIVIAVSVSTGLAEPHRVFRAPVHATLGKLRKVLVDLQPSEVCHFGDLDLLLNDLRSANGSLLLQLSIEEIGASDGAVVFGQPLEKMFKGANLGTYEVHLPDASEAKVYGVFLCSTAPKDLFKVPCSSHQIIPFGDAFDRYKVDFRPLLEGKDEKPFYTPPENVQPKVYFAQFLVDANKSVWALADSASEDIAKIFQDLGVPQAQRARGAKIIGQLNSALGSLPLRTTEQRLQIILPGFNDLKCNAQVKRSG